MHRSTPFARLGRELRHIRQAGPSSNVAHCLMNDKYSKSEPNNNRIGVQVRNIISLFPPKHVLMTTIATINILVQTPQPFTSTSSVDSFSRPISDRTAPLAPVTRSLLK